MHCYKKSFSMKSDFQENKQTKMLHHQHTILPIPKFLSISITPGEIRFHPYHQSVKFGSKISSPISAPFAVLPAAAQYGLSKARHASRWVEGDTRTRTRLSRSFSWQPNPLACCYPILRFRLVRTEGERTMRCTLQSYSSVVRESLNKRVQKCGPGSTRECITSGHHEAQEARTGCPQPWALCPLKMALVGSGFMTGPNYLRSGEEKKPQVKLGNSPL
jgi:hypothetical protein